jgi:Ca-activated chloride channel homolog
MALILYRPLYLVLACAAALVLLVIARRLRLRWWPAWLARLLIISPILLAIFFPGGEIEPRSMPPRQVLVIDASVSLPDVLYEEVFRSAEGWQSQTSNRLVIIFGTNLSSLRKEQGLPVSWVQAENMVSALGEASDFLGGIPGRVLLASAGVTDPDMAVEPAIARLVERGHTLDIVSYWEVQASLSEMVLADLAIDSMTLPSALWSGSSFNVSASISTLQPREVVLQWLANGALLSEEVHQLETGLHKFNMPLEAPSDSDLYALQLVAHAQGDQRLENNTYYAAVKVYPPPRVLVVTQTPEAAEKLVDLLRKDGMQVRVMRPEDMPSNLEALNDYRVIYLHNFLAEALTQEQMSALKIFVMKQGGGLVFLGGRNSYTLGGYKNTLLEPMLPVKLEPPPRAKPVTLVLMMDKSSSMRPYSAGKLQPIHLAREAAMRVIETLNPDDILGLMTYERDYEWVLPLGEVGGGLTLRSALDIISQITASGGTKIYLALKGAVAELESSGLAKGSNIILLSDGKSADGKRELFEALAQEAYEEGITISTVALGPDADHETMMLIASAGKGRYYEVLDPADLPRIMLSESEAARNENIQFGATSLKVGEENHPVLAGMRPADLPVLSAYNAVTSKTDLGAEDVLLSLNFKDPIFSVWQVGLGRVSAWMGDIGEEWSSGWFVGDRDERAVQLFWSQVVRYSLPDPSLGPVGIRVENKSASTEIEATVLDGFNIPVNFADPQYIFRDPAGEIEMISLPQSGPGSYEVDLPRRQAGVYRSIFRYQLEGKAVEIADHFVSNYPAQFARIDAPQCSANLVDWARLGNGRMTLLEDEIYIAEEIEGLEAQKTNPWKWLLLAVLIAWPVEMALRRRWLPWIT